MIPFRTPPMVGDGAWQDWLTLFPLLPTKTGLPALQRLDFALRERLQHPPPAGLLTLDERRAVRLWLRQYALALVDRCEARATRAWLLGGLSAGGAVAGALVPWLALPLAVGGVAAWAAEVLMDQQAQAVDSAARDCVSAIEALILTMD